MNIIDLMNNSQKIQNVNYQGDRNTSYYYTINKVINYENTERIYVNE